MKLIHVTDPHLLAPGRELYGLDPIARLEACIADINANQGDADLCVITGDLADEGEPEAYKALRDCLARLEVPWRVILGNHDDRQAFLAQFPETPIDTHGFVQDSFETPAGRFILIDTNHPGTHGGFLCEDRLRWLARALQESEGPLFLFLHHAPFPLGLPAMDRIGLFDPAAFEAVLRPHLPRIRHLFYGHVHRPVHGSWLGVPCSTVRATNHQVWLDLKDPETVTGSHEPPAYAIVLIDERSVVIHDHDFLYAGPRFSMGAPDYEEAVEPV